MPLKKHSFISHNEALDLYKEYIHLTYNFENFSPEEQNILLKRRWADKELSAAKLVSLYPDIMQI